MALRRDFLPLATILLEIFATRWHDSVPPYSRQGWQIRHLRTAARPNDILLVKEKLLFRKREGEVVHPFLKCKTGTG